MAATALMLRIRIERSAQGKAVYQADPNIGSNPDQPEFAVDVAVPVYDTNNVKALKQFITAMSQNLVQAATLTAISNDWGNSN